MSTIVSLGKTEDSSASNQALRFLQSDFVEQLRLEVGGVQNSERAVTVSVSKRDESDVLVSGRVDDFVWVTREAEVCRQDIRQGFLWRR